MSIINVNQIQPVGSGQTINVNASTVNFGTSIINADNIVVDNISQVSTIGVTTAYITNINDGPISGARNRIINGDMRIDQRNAGVSGTPGSGVLYSSVDRWFNNTNVASKFTVQQNAGSVTPPVGFTSYYGFTTISSYTPASNDYFLVGQAIEGFNIVDLAWGTSSAKSVTLSFWVRSSLTGTYSARLSGSSLVYIFQYTISSANTWEYKTITIPGSTSGTWDTNNGIGIALVFSLGVGSTRETASVNSWLSDSGTIYGITGSVKPISTLNATWYITGVQLEAGTVATPFERRSYGQELALCQRYYETNYQPGYTAGYNFGEGYPWTNSKAWGMNFNASDDNITAQSMYWKVTKRASPVVTIYSPNNGTAGQGYRYSGSAGTGNFAISVTLTTPDHALLNVTLAATSTTTEAYFMFTASSEL